MGIPQVLSWDAEFQPQPVSLFTDGAPTPFRSLSLEKLESKSVPKADIPRAMVCSWGKELGERLRPLQSPLSRGLPALTVFPATREQTSLVTPLR